MRSYFSHTLRCLGAVCAITSAQFAFAQRFIIGNLAKGSKYRIKLIVENANFSYRVDPGTGTWIYRWTTKENKDLGDNLFSNKFMIIDLGKEHIKDIEGDNHNIEKMTVKITDLDGKAEEFRLFVKHNEVGGTETGIEHKVSSKYVETIQNTIMLTGITFDKQGE